MSKRTCSSCSLSLCSCVCSACCSMTARWNGCHLCSCPIHLHRIQSLPSFIVQLCIIYVHMYQIELLRRTSGLGILGCCWACPTQQECWRAFWAQLPQVSSWQMAPGMMSGALLWPSTLSALLSGMCSPPGSRSLTSRAASGSGFADMQTRKQSRPGSADVLKRHCWHVPLLSVSGLLFLEFFSTLRGLLIGRHSLEAMLKEKVTAQVDSQSLG